MEETRAVLLIACANIANLLISPSAPRWTPAGRAWPPSSSPSRPCWPAPAGAVIVPDVNLLLYAEIDAFPQHEEARGWWEDALNGERQVGIAPVCLFGFIRIATNRRVLTDPLPVGDAIGRVQRWLERPYVVILVPGSRHLETAFRLLRSLDGR